MSLFLVSPSVAVTGIEKAHQKAWVLVREADNDTDELQAVMKLITR